MNSSNLKELQTIDSQILFSNKYWDYKLDHYELPDGTISEYHYVCSRGATMIIPKKNNNTFLMIRQYRYLNKRISIEFPGGGIKPGNSSEKNAREELIEETGFDADSIQNIGWYNPFNGVTDEICSIFLASGLKFQGANPDQSEEFELMELSKEEIINLIKKGDIWDGMTLAAWALFIGLEE